MNWATLSSGAAVISVSSEVAGCEAHHVLTEELSQIWLSDTGIPQWICISLQNIADHQNLEIRTVGWHCWHSYSTNPREVRIHVSRDGAKFRIWDTVSAAVQHQGTQLFCCAPISVALYPFIAFEILTTYGGPQTYMNRIYLYSDEFSPDSVASVSDYEKSSLNITMGLDGIKTADTSTLDDDDSRMDDFRPNRSRRNSARPSIQQHPSNVSADFLDPSQAAYPPGAPSTINKSTSAFTDAQLHDDYAAVLQSYDAYSHSLKSLTEDTTVLADRLSKAIGIDEVQGIFSPNMNSKQPPIIGSNPFTAHDISSMPRDGGLSPRSSYDHRLFRSPPIPNVIPNTRMWQSDTAALQQRREQHPHSIPSNVAHSQNADSNFQSSHLSSCQQPEISQQRVESLLSSHDGQLYYSTRKQLPMTTNTDTTPASSTSTLASMMRVPQKDIDSVLLSTASIQSMKPSVILPPSSSLPSTTAQASVNTSMVRLSSDDIDIRLRSLEDKFQTIVGLLETKQQQPSTSSTAAINSSISKENTSTKATGRNSLAEEDRGRHRSHSRHRHGKDSYGRSGESSHRRRSRSRSHSTSHRRHAHSHSRSPSRSLSPIVNYRRDHDHARSRSRSRSRSHQPHNRDSRTTQSRSRSASRSHSRSREVHSQLFQDTRHHRKPNALPTYRYSPHHQELVNSSSSGSEDDAFAAISPSRDRLEMQSLSSVHSEETSRVPENAGNNVISSENLHTADNSAKDSSSSQSRSASSHSGRNSDDDSLDRHTTTTSTSSILHRVLGKRSGEGVDQLVSRILSEAKQHGRLSDHAASLLRRQTLSTHSLSNNQNSNYFDDLLPSAKIALSTYTPSTAPDQSRLLTPAARSILDERIIDDEAAQVAVNRVLEKRYPFPVEQSTTDIPSQLSSRISSLQATASQIASQQGTRQTPLPTSHTSGIRQHRSTGRDVEDGDDLSLRIDRLVKDLHHCVLQRTVKEAQLKLLRGEDPASICSL